MAKANSLLQNSNPIIYEMKEMLSELGKFLKYLKERKKKFLAIVGLILFTPIAGVVAQVTNENTMVSYSTIQSAINAATAGDIISVIAGTYTENVTLDRAITLRGPNYAIVGTGTRVAEAILKDDDIYISSNSVSPAVFEGFRVERLTRIVGPSNAGTALLMSGASKAIVQNNVFVRTATGFGSQDFVSAIMTSSGTGAKVIKDNLFTLASLKKWRAGIWMNGPNVNGSIDIKNNTFNNCNTGINLDYYNATILIRFNTFNSNNGTQIAFGGSPTGQYVWEPNEFGLNSTIINLSNVAPSFRLDIWSSTFGSTPSVNLSFAQLFSIEGKMKHRGNGGNGNGAVVFKENSHMVTTATKIQSAVDAAYSGETIYVNSGTFTESVLVNKDSLTFQGLQFATSVLGRTNANASNESKIKATTGSGGAFTTPASGVENLTIRGFSILSNGGTTAGLKTSGLVDNMLVEGNIFDGYVNQISFSPTAGSSNVVFNANRVQNSTSGPYYPNGVSGTISNNFITGASEGVVLEGADNDVQVVHNVLNNNSKGVYVLSQASAGGTDNLNNTFVSENDLSANTQFLVNERNVALNAKCNWHGFADSVAINVQNSGDVDLISFLNNGSNTVAATSPGFVPLANACIETSPLGVNFVSFLAQRNGCSAEMFWTTSDETNTAPFSLERSKDGKSFINIANIPSSGLRSTLQTYRFVDIKPFSGTNYYRIRQTELDNITAITAVKKVEIDCNKSSVSIYPNPAKEVIQIKGAINGQTAEIFNVLGQLVQRIEIGNETENINISKLTKGVYHLRIVENNESIFSRKLVIE